MTTLETGNVVPAGTATRGWFVGDLAAWAAARGDALDPRGTPRQSEQLQIKWFVHPPGHARESWAEPDRYFALGILVDGDMHLDFRSIEGEERSVELRERGDYVLWHGPSYAHSWRSAGGCTFITVRWPVTATV